MCPKSLFLGLIAIVMPTIADACSCGRGRQSDVGDFYRQSVTVFSAEVVSFERVNSYAAVKARLRVLEVFKGKVESEIEVVDTHALTSCSHSLDGWKGALRVIFLRTENEVEPCSGSMTFPKEFERNPPQIQLLEQLRKLRQEHEISR